MPNREFPPRRCHEESTSQHSATARSHLAKQREREDHVYLLKDASVPACLGGKQGGYNCRGDGGSLLAELRTH